MKVAKKRTETGVSTEMFDAAKKAVAEHLSMYEQADKEIVDLYAQHSALFEKLESLETAKKEASESIKRLLYSKIGPPVGVPASKETCVASGAAFQVSVVYPMSKPTINPAKLPSAVLTYPGVVVEVDADLLRSGNEDLLMFRKAIANATEPGKPQSSRVSIKQIEIAPAEGGNE